MRKNNNLFLCKLLVNVIITSAFYLTSSCQQDDLKYDEDGNAYKEILHLLDNTTERVEYFANGEVKARGSFKEGIKHGDHFHYYENGKMKSKSSYIDGSIEGSFEYFYQNGRLRKIIPFSDDIPVGWSYEYWENGRKKRANQFVKFGEDSRVNQFIKYDCNGVAINDSSHYMRINTESDTVLLGEDIIFHFELVAPFFKKESNMRILIGGFDSSYAHVDPTKTDTIESEILKASYMIKPDKRGKQYIRGRVDDYRIEILENSEYEYMEEEVNIYFTKEFFVK